MEGAQYKKSASYIQGERGAATVAVMSSFGNPKSTGDVHKARLTAEGAIDQIENCFKCARGRATRAPQRKCLCKGR